MPGQFHIELDEVRAAAGEMSRVSEALGTRISMVADEADRLEDALDVEQFTGVGAVARMTAEWADRHLKGHRETVEEIAAFLSSHAENMSEIDQVVAGTIDEHRP